MIAVGGFDGTTGLSSAKAFDPREVEIYEPRANRWRAGPTLMSRRSGAGVTVVAYKLVTVGGHDGPLVRDTAEVSDDGTMDLSSIEKLDLSILGEDVSQTWAQLEVRMNRPRSYAGIALLPKLI
uniref:Uncharacterized protein n=1 Tax=Parascaris univalens TaxID=6257 RepID=A0A915BZ93_PARUN